MNMMRILPFLILFLSTFCGFAQNAFTVEMAEKNMITVDQLNVIYKNATNENANLGVFKTDSDKKKLEAAYQKFLTDVNVFLAGKGFKWENMTRCFNRIYVSQDGTIDYYIYNFQEFANGKLPTAELQQKFDTLMNEFVKSYKFKATATVRFVQTGVVKFLPK